MKHIHFILCSFVFSFGQLSHAQNLPCVARFSTIPVCVSLNWQTPPTAGVEAAADVLFTQINSPTTENVDPAKPSQTLKFFLWMPAMGHGSSPITVTKGEIGQYGLIKVQFIMGGLWELRIQIKDGISVVDEVKIPIQL